MDASTFNAGDRVVIHLSESEPLTGTIVRPTTMRREHQMYAVQIDARPGVELEFPDAVMTPADSAGEVEQS